MACRFWNAFLYDWCVAVCKGGTDGLENLLALVQEWQKRFILYVLHAMLLVIDKPKHMFINSVESYHPPPSILSKIRPAAAYQS